MSPADASPWPVNPVLVGRGAAGPWSRCTAGRGPSSTSTGPSCGRWGPRPRDALAQRGQVPAGPAAARVGRRRGRWLRRGRPRAGPLLPQRRGGPRSGCRPSSAGSGSAWTRSCAALRSPATRPRGARCARPVRRPRHSTTTARASTRGSSRRRSGTGDDPARYLEPDSAVQRAVHAAVVDLCGLKGPVPHVIDGCSAPTWRLSVRALGTAFARVGTPSRLASERAAACRRLTSAAAAHPTLIAGRHKRLCTALVEASGGNSSPNRCGGPRHRPRGLGRGARAQDGRRRRARPARSRPGPARPPRLARRGRPGRPRRALRPSAKNWAGREVARARPLDGERG